MAFPVESLLSGPAAPTLGLPGIAPAAGLGNVLTPPVQPLTGVRGSSRAPYFTSDQIRKITARASVDNKLWRERCRKWRAEFSAGYASEDNARLDHARGPEAVDEDKVIANYTFSFITILLAMMYADSPSIDVSPREATGAASPGLMQLLQAGALQGVASLADAREMYSETVEQELDYSFECGNGGVKTAMSLQDALICGQSWAKGIFDEDTGLDDVEILQREEVYVDPAARYDVTQARFVCHTVTLPLREAQDFIAAKMDAFRTLHAQNGGGVDDSGNPLGAAGWAVAPEFSVEKLAGNARSGESFEDAQNAGSQGDNDEYRFYELWVKEGNDRFVYYTSDEGGFLFRLPWPFTFSHGEFPFVEHWYNRKGQTISDAFSELRVVDGLKKTYGLMTQYMRKRVLRAMAQKIIIDESLGLTEKDIDKLLDSNGGELDALLLKLGGKKLSDVIQVLNLNGDDPVLNELIGELKTQFDEILGADELLRGAAQEDPNMTATQARIMNANMHSRLGRKVGLFDQFQTSVLRMRAAIARQAVSPDKINLIAGQQAALLWSVEASHPDDFHAEYEISIESGSSGQSHRSQKTQTLQQLGTLAQGVNTALMQMQQPPVFDIREIAISTARAIDANGERFILPEAPGPVGMPGQMPAPAGTGGNGPPPVAPAQPQQMPR